MYTRLKSDLINNIDHMRISDTEPSSVILCKLLKLKELDSDVLKVTKQA